MIAYEPRSGRLILTEPSVQNVNNALGCGDVNRAIELLLGLHTHVTNSQGVLGGIYHRQAVPVLLSELQGAIKTLDKKKSLGLTERVRIRMHQRSALALCTMTVKTWI